MSTLFAEVALTGPNYLELAPSLQLKILLCTSLPVITKSVSINCYRTSILFMLHVVLIRSRYMADYY